MSYIDRSVVIDGETGQALPFNDPADNARAVRSQSYVHAASFLPGLEGLPRGARVAVETDTDLTPLRLDRSAAPGQEQRFTFDEVRAALSHPETTPAAIVNATDPPERGQVLAVHKALTGWLAWVEREWQDLAPAEALSESAEETLEPVLLDLYGEACIRTPRQMAAWLEGVADAIPAGVARTCEDILESAYGVWTHSLRTTLDRALRAIATREGVDHVWTVFPHPRHPNALQCAYALTRPWYTGTGPRVLWHPSVDPTSTADEVRIALAGREEPIEPTIVTIDRESATLMADDERTRFEHEGTEEGTTTAANAIVDRLAALVRALRLERYERAGSSTLEIGHGPIEDLQ